MLLSKMPFQERLQTFTQTDLYLGIRNVHYFQISLCSAHLSLLLIIYSRIGKL